MTVSQDNHDTREQASIAAADRMAAALLRRLALAQSAAIAVSGGTTPQDCLRRLSMTALDWKRVWVVPTDERWVPPEDSASNERMIRQCLLARRAHKASLLPIYRQGLDPVSACTALARDLRALPLPYACCLLGMGDDGHFASLFPDNPDLDSALDPQGAHPCVAIETAASPLPRVSLTLSALLQSDEIILLIFGEAKRDIVAAAIANPDIFPVGALLHQVQVPVRIVWAP